MPRKYWADYLRRHSPLRIDFSEGGSGCAQLYPRRRGLLAITRASRRPGAVVPLTVRACAVTTSSASWTPVVAAPSGRPPYLDLIRTPAPCRAVHPGGDQHVQLPERMANDSRFGPVRTAPDGDRGVRCIHNVSSRRSRIRARLHRLPMRRSGAWEDVISGQVLPSGDGRLVAVLAAYQVLWLKAVAH